MPMTRRTTVVVTRDENNECTVCGAHIADPHNPECPHADDPWDQTTSVVDDIMELLEPDPWRADNYYDEEA